MIGFILGTSEGKEFLSLINKYTDKIVVSTATNYGGELLKNYKVHHINTKPLDKEDMKNLIREFSLTVLVDASHPYAKEVSINAMEACLESSIEYVRYERNGILEQCDDKRIIRVKDYNKLKDIIENILKDDNVEGTILNTTGSNNIYTLMNLNIDCRMIHRILPSPSILKKIVDLGVDIEDIVAIKGPIGYELNKAFISQYKAKAMITKDSGAEGGVEEKLKACIDMNIKLIVIEKPKINYGKVFNDKKELIRFLKNKFTL